MQREIFRPGIYGRTDMKLEERVDKIDDRLRAIDRKVLLISVIGAIFILRGNIGAMSGLLTGAVIAPEVTTMEINPVVWMMLAAFAGSVFRCYIGYANKKHLAAWDWNKFLISVLPTAVGAAGAAVGFSMEVTAQTLVMMFFGAAGLNSLQDKMGLQKQ